MHDIALFGEVLADCFPDQTVLGGAPYNVTRHLHGFQQHPLLISKAGNDALKEQLLSELKRLGISQAGIQTDAAYPTGKVIVHIENKTHHFNIRPNQAYDYIDAEDAIKAITSINPSIIYFGTLIQRGKVSSAALSRILSDNITPCFLDINLRAPWYNKQIIETALHSANFVKVSEEELTTIARLFEPQAMSLKEVAFFLIKKFNLDTLFTTCGEKGAWSLSSAGEYIQVEGELLGSALVDTVGAGDAFSSVCILGILYQWPTKKIMDRANAFAVEICKVRGAAPKTNNLYLPFTS